MAPNLTSGHFKIVSLTEGNPPTGINPILPAFQPIRLDGRIQDWVLRKDGDTFQLSIGGYQYTGVIDNKVTASTHPDHETKWHATYREREDAYTIELADDHSKGWTRENDQVEIRVIIIQPSEPPRYLPTQLFRLVPVHG